MYGKYALLIGNDHYDDSRFNPLNAPLRDVDALRDVLLRPDIGAFNDVTVLPNPSVAEAQRAVNVLFAGKSKDDLLLFYYSGHGVKDHHGDLFFTLKASEWEFLDSTALSSFAD